ncbi:DUF2924 domain-containing protein [Sansalvadorimonas sp. 2012CJ34-2]|uniref:DUF2924 domain-containing protein n=1 Tax=Parendozoicomonas callyspongiae TaxID=2942213 RepID=A0ABT0PFV8_9GAMM|nr:DUF2924 domain-containing protein [Sansalvadorimonas sp. 2012CJ34-2]MCL6270257.1 DUF2924 domain-containing protein [Sansalvadorimonas sp. 2012CJ34-2]
MADSDKVHETLAAQVAKIMTMNNTQLNHTWKELLGTDAPPLHTKILRQRLAWKVQEKALGGLSDLAKKRLLQVKQSILKGKKTPRAKTCHLPAGTRLMREYQHEEHEVVVTNEGFEYRGQLYKSLTAIAKVITGSQWNGPAFFGLRKEQQKQSSRRRKRK